MKNIRSSYKYYRDKGYDDLHINDFAKIVNEFNKFIAGKIFDGQEVKLPLKMGIVSVKGKKVALKFDEDGNIDSKNLDYKATNDLWNRCPECKERKQKVFHLNEHTNSVRYKFFWSKERMIVKNKMFYDMVFTRTNKRNLAHLIFAGKEFYVEPIKEK